MANLEVKYETCSNETCFEFVLGKGIETVKISLQWCWGWHVIDVHADGSTPWRTDCSSAEMCLIAMPLQCWWINASGTVLYGSGSMSAVCPGQCRLHGDGHYHVVSRQPLWSCWDAFS